MELKVVCDCGQKYAFDVEPIANQMPFFVNCPSCGMDGTATANSLLAQSIPAAAAPARIPVAVRLAGAAPVAQTAVHATPPPLPAGPPAGGAPSRQWEKSDMTEVHSIALGILGAIIGALLGVGIMIGFLKVVGIAFPMMGLAIGALTGFGARLLYKGTDMTLGAVAAAIALVATGGAFLMLFGIFAIMNLISLIVSVMIAYKIAG